MSGGGEPTSSSLKRGRPADGEGGEVRPRIKTVSALVFPMTAADTTREPTVAGILIPDTPTGHLSHPGDLIPPQGGNNLEAIIHNHVHPLSPNRWAAQAHKDNGFIILP